ncbi:MAG TPA: hypothetical protein VHX44_02010 [Planctomycetota bacterium]|nr:hypothetical protein [Planctomycetota bacterium]
MTTLRLASATLLLLGASAVASAADDVASDYWVRVMPSAWFVGFDGKAKYTADGTTGDKLSLDDLDLANQEAGFGLEVSAKLPILFSFHAGGYVVGTDGSFNATGVDFGGKTFNGSVDSSIDVSDLYGEADLQLLDLDLVGFAIGVGYHFMNTEVKLSGGGNSASLNEDFQFPVVALRAHANLPFLTSLGAEAKVHWMDLSLNDTSVGYLDATLQITWRPWEMLGFIGGYRYVAADIGFDNPAGGNADAYVDITLAGPFLGLTAQF